VLSEALERGRPFAFVEARPVWLPGWARPTRAANGESEQTPEQSPDRHRDAQRDERVPTDLESGVGRSVFDRMASGDDRLSDVPHVLFDG
jgi:hypothetical protein